MVAVINVFYRGNEDEVSFINVLVKYGFVHYVDSERYKDENWVESNRKKGVIYNSKLVTYNGCTTRELHRVERVDGPGMFVLIVDCLETNPCFYDDVEEFISACYDGSIAFNVEKYMELLDMHPVQKTKSLEKAKQKRSIEDSVSSDSPDQGYSFEFKKLDDLDCMFYQLTRPNTDRPYVVLVKNHSKHGHKRLFSSMRLFDSWGGPLASEFDITFLYKVWEHLGEKGKPDFDQILEEHVKACLEGEEEPKVWRNNLGTVVSDYIKNVRKSSSLQAYQSHTQDNK